jgi:hypothetical protein
MSGYLRRLAASARHSVSTIRPMAGSLYAPAAPPGSPAPSRIEDETVARPDLPGSRTSPDGRRQPAGPARAEPGVTRDHPPLVDPTLTQSDAFPAGPDSSTIGPVQIAAIVGPKQPIYPVPRAQSDRSNDQPTDRGIGERSGQTPRSTSGVSDVAAKWPAVQDAHMAASPAGRRQPPAPPSLGDAIERLTRPAPRPEPRVPPVPAAQPAREPDTIEIHIGRIEVSAVLPPPAPPATKQARPGLNLSEYLTGGDRRTR